MSDQADVDCASCGYEIRDFSNVVQTQCRHGYMHYNCSYFNMNCNVCDLKLTADTELTQFRPRIQQEESKLKEQLSLIGDSLGDLKNLILEQKEEQNKSSKVVEKLLEQIKAKDEKIIELQKVIYELELEKVEKLKQELQEKLGNLSV